MGVGVSIVSYLYVSFSGLITLIVDKRANYSAIYRLLIMWFLFGGVFCSSLCLDRLWYFSVALSGAFK